jgi:hypothetical protein
MSQFVVKDFLLKNPNIQHYKTIPVVTDSRAVTSLPTPRTLRSGGSVLKLAEILFTVYLNSL